MKFYFEFGGYSEQLQCFERVEHLPIQGEAYKLEGEAVEYVKRLTKQIRETPRPVGDGITKITHDGAHGARIDKDKNGCIIFDRSGKEVYRSPASHPSALVWSIVMGWAKPLNLGS